LTPPSSDFKKAIELDIDLAIPSLKHLELIVAAGKALGKNQESILKLILE
jgi:hypothetical protein